MYQSLASNYLIISFIEDILVDFDLFHPTYSISLATLFGICGLPSLERAHTVIIICFTNNRNSIFHIHFWSLFAWNTFTFFFNSI